MAHGQVMIQQQGERTVHVKRTDLISKLRDNLEAHQKQYKVDCENYKEAAIGKLEEAVKKAEQALTENRQKAIDEIGKFGEELEDSAEFKFSDHFVLVREACMHMPVPKDHSEDYERAISLFEWDQRVVIELTTAEFDTFVLDKWHWTHDFYVNSSNYERLASTWKGQQ